MNGPEAVRQRRGRRVVWPAPAWVCLWLGLAGAAEAQRDNGTRAVGVVPSERAAGGDSSVRYRRCHAVLVGINRYPNLSSDYQLRYAVRDAEALRDVLVGEYGFVPADTRLLTDADATKANILAALADLADTARVAPDDAVLFFFAGHGVDIGDENKEGFILPCDADVDLADADNPAQYIRTCISMGDLLKSLRLPRCRARHRLLLLDACYSGLLLQTRTLTPRPMTPDYVRRFMGLEALQVLTAGAAGQPVVERPDLGHSPYSFKVIEALRRGGIDRDGDGVILGSELATYVKTQVANLQVAQTPQYAEDGPGDFLLFHRPEPPVVPPAPTPRPTLIPIPMLRPTPTPIPPTPAPRPSDLSDLSDGSDKGRSYTETHGGLNLEMVWIPGGTFEMGSNDAEAADNEKPVHTVELDGFWIGKCEVTQRQYEAWMGKNPSQFQGPDRPVEMVSWDDAMAFCVKLSQATGKQYTLPTEAQWEYACRAGSSGNWCFGDDESRLGDYAWHGGNSHNQTHDVAAMSPNAWGLYDMHGNVAEWCADWLWWYESRRRVRNPTGPATGQYRVMRGGACGDRPYQCRSADRGNFKPGNRHLAVGFRLARTQK